MHEFSVWLSWNTKSRYGKLGTFETISAKKFGEIAVSASSGSGKAAEYQVEAETSK